MKARVESPVILLPSRSFRESILWVGELQIQKKLPDQHLVAKISKRDNIHSRLSADSHGIANLPSGPWAREMERDARDRTRSRKGGLSLRRRRSHSGYGHYPQQHLGDIER